MNEVQVPQLPVHPGGGVISVEPPVPKAVGVSGERGGVDGLVPRCVISVNYVQIP